MMRIDTLFRPLPVLAAMLMAGTAPVAFAQVQADAPPPSESAMVNLVRLLVQQGVLKADAGQALLQQAEAEAAQARTLRAAQTPAQTAGGDLPPAAAGAIRVPYIPQSVRDQIKSELRTEVMQEARQGNWAAPDSAAPEWTRRVTLYGDIRVRSQSELYSKANATGLFDYAAFNNIAPFDYLNARDLPFLNSTQDRWNRANFRARLGVRAEVTPGVVADVRLATGDDNSPVSTNAILGGGLTKRGIWLDRASITVKPFDSLSASFGRFANPFADKAQLLFDDDLNFDGVAAEANIGKLAGLGFDLTLRGGAFPLDFGSANYPVLNPVKRSGLDRYLFSAELAAGVKLSGVRLDAAVAYHDFAKMQGQLSDSCNLDQTAECSTDQRQPLFLRKGNTLSPLRSIDAASIGQEQILGYTFAYRVLNANASVSIPVMEDVGVTLYGAYAKNLAFKQGDICRNGQAGQPFNNGALVTGGDPVNFCGVTTPLRFIGGDTGYTFGARLGHDIVRKAGSWSAMAGYRYLESDATLDAFTDSDFHLGGTNAKGYIIGAEFAPRNGLTLGARWLSANQIDGDPLAIDVLQVDLGVEF